MSRVERKMNHTKRVAYFRNEMNKAWIGAKRSENPVVAMRAKAIILHRGHPQESPTVVDGVNQWYERHSEVDR